VWYNFLYICIFLIYYPSHLYMVRADRHFWLLFTTNTLLSSLQFNLYSDSQLTNWKSGKTASSSFNLVIERKYLFKTLDSCYWIMSSMFYREWKPCLFIAWESAHLVQCFGKPFHLRCLPWKNACYLSTQLPCYTTRNYTLWTFSFEANSWLTCLLLNAEQSTSCHELPSYPLLPFTCFELAFYLKI
jgi:hypothetical protein